MPWQDYIASQNTNDGSLDDEGFTSPGESDGGQFWYEPGTQNGVSGQWKVDRYGQRIEFIPDPGATQAGRKKWRDPNTGQVFYENPDGTIDWANGPISSPAEPSGGGGGGPPPITPYQQAMLDQNQTINPYQQAMLDERMADREAALTQAEENRKLDLYQNIGEFTKGPGDVAAIASFLNAGGLSPLSTSLGQGESAITDFSISPLAAMLQQLLGLGVGGTGDGGGTGWWWQAVAASSAGLAAGRAAVAAVAVAVVVAVVAAGPSAVVAPARRQRKRRKGRSCRRRHLTRPYSP